MNAKFNNLTTFKIRNIILILKRVAKLKPEQKPTIK